MNTPQPKPIVLDAAPLSIDQVVSVARLGVLVSLSPASRAKVAACRAVVEAATKDGLAHYGINTGFGSLARQRVGNAELRQLQTNLIRSHAAGVGAPLPTDVVRGTMLLLAASLSRGFSGVRPIVIESILGMLNAGITPVVPSIGSVGASGDLAPLAHIGLAMLGEGNVEFRGAVMLAGEALTKAELKPLELEAKEGLAIINGTHLMASLGSLALDDATRVFDAAVVAAAMSIDACRGTDAFLDERIHAVRNQPGQQLVAERLRELLKGSEIVPSHAENDPRVQDPYSLRCTPQVLGAARDAIGYVKQAIERELGAVTDNPLVFMNSAVGQDSIVSGGNFHGMPLAIPLDVLSIAMSHVAGISERRTFWLLAGLDSESHLRPYLTPQPGLCSGLMIAQYTAAACCNEIVGLCTPASVANIPTSAGIEDYNSFGPRAGMKAHRVIELARNVVAIELLSAAEGLEYQRPLKSGSGVELAHATIRSKVARLTNDRSPAPDIATIAEMVRIGVVG
jgi:histidine ammonia-lyase